MVETVGRRLQKARQEKKLTIDEVAAATKIRPERIVDLEADDLTHFPSLVYARSFLVKYAKFLGLNIQDDLDNFQVTRSVGFGEFKYLAVAPPPKYRPEPRLKQSRGAPVPPVALAIVAVLVLIGIPLIAFFAINLSRLSTPGEEQHNVAVETPTPETKPSVPVAAASTESSSRPGASPAGSAQISTLIGSPTPSPAAATPGPTVEVRRALPVTSTSPDKQPSASPGSTEAASHKLEIKVKERTWLRITKDRQNSEPVFNDFIGPNSPAIVIQGKRFWLKALDKNALELRKNGQAVNGQDSDIVIE